MIQNGIDALILEGNEAGGHIGPVSVNVLVQEILPHIKEVPIFVAGGIGRGEIILKFLQLGAAGCQIGTRFVCANESIAHSKFKNIFIKSEARNAQISVKIEDRLPVIPVRAIENSATQNFISEQKKLINLVEKSSHILGAKQVEPILFFKSFELKDRHFMWNRFKRELPKFNVTKRKFKKAIKEI